VVLEAADEVDVGLSVAVACGDALTSLVIRGVAGCDGPVADNPVSLLPGVALLCTDFVFLSGQRTPTDLQSVTNLSSIISTRIGRRMHS
jgi:hypothetical protein